MMLWMTTTCSMHKLLAHTSTVAVAAGMAAAATAAAAAVAADLLQLPRAACALLFEVFCQRNDALDELSCSMHKHKMAQVTAAVFLQQGRVVQQ